jgi:hypothetical protein
MFMSLGYWWRPSFGSHWTFDSSREDALSVHDGVEAAAKTYYQLEKWSVDQCLFHNTDTAQLLGEDVPACLVPWAPQLGLPIELLMADVTYNLSDAAAAAVHAAARAAGSTDEQARAATMAARAASGLLAVGASRLALSDFSPTHWLHKQRLDKRLGGATLTDDDRDALHMDAELAYLTHLKRCWAREPGTGFEPGGAFANEKFMFVVGRSIVDILAETAVLDLVPVVVVYVLMIGYVGATLLGWQSGVRSHFWVGIGGVLIIACAVATSLGCGAWLGIPFSATATNVVPFVALGIGIDDMLVIVHEYAALLRREASRPDGRKQYRGDSAPLIGDLLAETGPSVFFTSLTNAIAFATATLAPIAIVQLLAQMMVVAGNTY